MPEPATIKSLMGQTGIVKMPSTPANSLVAHALTRSGHEPSTSATSSAKPEQREQRAPRARGRRRAPLERRQEHLDAHEPAVQHRVRELQEHARDERQRHHLRDAGDRVVEHRARRDVGRRSGTSARTPRRRRPRSARRRASRTASRRVASVAGMLRVLASRSAIPIAQRLRRRARATRSCTRAALRRPDGRGAPSLRSSGPRCPASRRATSASRRAGTR